jgi:membrane-bound inhibitor of C-type lysozyme
MNKKIVFIVLTVIIAAGTAMWYAGSKMNKSAPAASSSQPSSTELVAEADYVCDGGKTINAAFYKGDVVAVKPGEPPVPTGSVRIALDDGRNFDLFQTLSASGARYANADESFVFWSKGDGAIVQENGAEKEYTGCAVPAGAVEAEGIKIRLPNGGETWTKGQAVKISWSAAKNITFVNVRLSILDGGEGQIFNAAIASGIPNTGEYVWTVQDLYAEAQGVTGLPASDKYQVIVEDMDHNEVYDTSDAVFTIKDANK